MNATFKRHVRLYWRALRGKSFACSAAFDGMVHVTHDWTSMSGRTYHCGGWA